MTYCFDVRQWRAVALRSPGLTSAVKVLLVVLADNMDTTGTVSVPRRLLAARCGCSEPQVSERLKKAVDARFLSSVSTGKKGHTAVYRALRQTSESSRQNRTLCPPKQSVSPDALAPVKPTALDRPLSVNGSPKQSVEPTPSSKHTGTAAGRAACEPGTTQLRNDGGTEQPARPDCAVAVDRVDGAA